MLAEDQSPQQVASVLGCSLARLYNGAATWQQDGQSRLREARPAGRTRPLDAAARRLVEQWVTTEPQTLGEQTTGWREPLLPTRLTQAGYASSPRTRRRAWHRLGWRWRRPKDGLGRPDPAYEGTQGRWSRGSSRH